ncbi:hypothetical protein AAVH_38724, partial [Aphelenchoides avenae]
MAFCRGSEWQGALRKIASNADSFTSLYRLLVGMKLFVCVTLALALGYAAGEQPRAPWKQCCCPNWGRDSCYWTHDYFCYCPPPQGVTLQPQPGPCSDGNYCN